MGQFDRVAFKNSGERLFDQQFDFQRPLSETFSYMNINAKGGLKERLGMRETAHTTNIPQNEKQEVAQQENPKSYLNLPEPTNYLGLLLERQDADPLATGLKRKKKRRKDRSQDNEQGLSM
ncbi:hypothetical protein D9M68_954290 [compost metagenome]